jgi:hypothetical protein
MPANREGIAGRSRGLDAWPTTEIMTAQWNGQM